MHTLTKKFLFTVLATVLPAVSFARGEMKSSSEIDGAIVSGTIINLYCEIAHYMSGPIGVMIGLAVALYGFYKFIMSGSYMGILIIVMGAIIPSFPSVYAGVSEFAAAVFPKSYNAQQQQTAGKMATEMNKACSWESASLVQPFDIKAYRNAQRSNEGNNPEEKKEQKSNTEFEQKYNFQNIGKHYGTLDVR